MTFYPGTGPGAGQKGGTAMDGGSAFDVAPATVAADHRTRPAVVADDATLTYVELDAMTRALAKRFARAPAERCTAVIVEPAAGLTGVVHLAAALRLTVATAVP